MSGEETRLSALLSEELARTSWGAPPCLYSIWARDGDWAMRPAAIPPGAWQAGPPQLVVAMMAFSAAALAANPEYRPPDGLHGMAVRAEFGHPGRTHFRYIAAADLAGVTYSAVQSPGSSRVTTAVTAPSDRVPHDRTLPSALARLIRGLTGTAGREPEAGL